MTFKKLFKFFHTIFWQYFSQCPASLSTKLYVLSLSKKWKKTETNKPIRYKQTTTTNTQTKPKWTIKKSTKETESYFCWPTTPERRPCSVVWLIDQVSLHWRKLTFSFPADISYIASWSEGCLRPLSLLSVGVFSGLNLYRSWACCQSLCEFVCVASLLCLSFQDGLMGRSSSFWTPKTSPKNDSLVSSIPNRQLGEILPPFWVLVNKVNLLKYYLCDFCFLHDLIALVILTCSVCAYCLVWVTFISLVDSFFDLTLFRDCDSMHQTAQAQVRQNCNRRRNSGPKVPCLSRKLLTNNSFCARGKPVFFNEVNIPRV